MSKPSYYYKSHRNSDTTRDLLETDYTDDRRNHLPPPAHTTNSSTFIPSRKLPNDVSFIPVGVNYSLDSISVPQSSADCHGELSISEVPNTGGSSFTSMDVPQNYVNSHSRSGKHLVGSSSLTSHDHTKPSSTQPIRTQSLLPRSVPHSSSQSEQYGTDFIAESSQRSSADLVHSSILKSIYPSDHHGTVTSIPKDLMIWDMMSRRSKSPPNTRSTMSPAFTQPQISSQPFSFSPLPGILPPFNTSILPLPTTSLPSSLASNSLPIELIGPSHSAIFKHSISNNNGVAFDNSAQSPASLSAMFSNFSSNNTSPSNSRSVTPTNYPINSRSQTPPKTFIVPGHNIQTQKSIVGTHKRSHGSRLATMVPEVINLATDPMENGAAGSRDKSDSLCLSSVMDSQSKYNQLLSLLQDMEKDIRPSYAGSKSSIERLKRGIIHSRILIREAIAEIEKSPHRNESDEWQMITKYAKVD